MSEQKRDWLYFRDRLGNDIHLNLDFERLQAELDGWAAYLEQQETKITQARALAEAAQNMLDCFMPLDEQWGDGTPCYEEALSAIGHDQRISALATALAAFHAQVKS